MISMPHRVIELILVVCCILVHAGAGEISEPEYFLGLLKSAQEALSCPHRVKIEFVSNQTTSYSGSATLEDARRAYPQLPKVTKDSYVISLGETDAFTYLERDRDTYSGDGEVRDHLKVFWNGTDSKTLRFGDVQSTTQSGVIWQGAAPDLRTPLTPRRLYTQVPEFSAFAELLANPSLRVSIEQSDGSQAIIRLDCSNTNTGRTETIWLRSDYTTTWPTKGHVKTPGQVEATFEVLDTKRVELGGVSVAFATSVHFTSVVKNMAYVDQTFSVKEVTEDPGMRPDNFDFQFTKGTRVYDKRVGYAYIVGADGDRTVADDLKVETKIALNDVDAALYSKDALKTNQLRERPPEKVSPHRSEGYSFPSPGNGKCLVGILVVVASAVILWLTRRGRRKK